MKIAGITLFTLLFASIGLAQSDSGYMPMDNPRMVRLLEMDSLSEVYFGEDLADLLQNTRRIEAFKLSKFLPDSEEGADLLEGFRVLDTVLLSQDAQREIASMLTNTEPYIVDKNIKNLCLFLPNYGLSMLLDDTQVNALVSLKCKMVRFYFEQDEQPVHYQEFNIKGNYEGFDAFYAATFPKAKPKALPLFTKSTPKPATVAIKGKPLYYKVKKGEGWSHVARNASKLYRQEISMTDIFEINKEKSLSKTVMLRPGDKILVGYEN